MDIQKLWDIQSKFFEQVKGMNEDMTNEEFCHSLCLHLHAEVSELLEAIGGPWKTHLRKSTEMRKSQVLSEVVDITKLAWEIAIAFGIDSYEFEEKFRLKSRVVTNRLASEQFLMENQSPVVVMDFDGVIADYPGPFVEYVKEIYPEASIDIKSPDDLWTQIGISIEEYEWVKKSYWESRRSLRAEVNRGVKELINETKYPVVIVTSRDRKSLEVAEHDLYEWMHHYDVHVDGVYFSDDKARFIKKNFKEVVVVMEDDPHEVDRLRSAGFNVLHVENGDARPKPLKW